MQVSVESTGALERRMRVEVPEDRITNEVKTRLQSLTKTVRIDGFRQGKVPVRIIQQRYGKQVRYEVLTEVMRETYAEALQEEKLIPAGEPNIETSPEDEDSSNFTYTATFEIYPEISLNPIDKLNITLPECEVADADVDKMIENLRSQHSDWNPVERQSANDDKLTIDFIGYVDDEKFEGGEAEDFEIELGSGRMIDGFEEGLKEHSAGDKVTLNLAFPDEYHNTELAAKPVRFEVTVKSVSEKVLPELNEEFFERFGVKEGGLDALKTMVRDNMERECEVRVKSQAKERVFKALIEDNQIELPASAVENEAAQILESSKQRLIQQGMPADQLDSMDKEAFLDDAKRRVALGLLISDIIKSNELEADTGKVREMIEQISASYEDPAAVSQYYYSDQKRMADVQNMVLEQEVVDLIMNQANVSKETVSLDSLMSSESV